jgi:hypothetical protein
LRLTEGTAGFGQKGLLEADSAGKVRIASEKLSVEGMTVASDAKVNGKLTVNTLQFNKANYQVSGGILALDKDTREVYSVKNIQMKDGQISAGSADFKGGFVSAKTATIGSLQGSLDAQNNVISNARIEASKISGSEIILDTLVDERGSPLSNGGQLVFRSIESGQLAASESVAIDKDGVIHAKGIAPLVEEVGGVNSFVDISNARLTNSVIESSKLVNITSIETDRIDFVGGDGLRSTEVYVKGSLMVHGFIQGSGSYIDNSDKRLKKDIEPMTGVLDKIDNIQAVTYSHRIDEYPERNLDPRRQVGWIADDLNNTLPELVTTDRDGFLAVSYSRSAAILAEAIKELKAKYESRIADLERRLDEATSKCQKDK